MTPMDAQAQRLEWLEPSSPEAWLPDRACWPWLAVAAILLLTGVLVIVIVRRRKPAPDHLTSLRHSAFLEATAALAAIATADVREAAVRASLILRNYLSVATGDPALFETHEEFLARHDALCALTPDARDAAATAFKRLALLKYAPVLPAAQSADVIAEAREMLEILHHGMPA